MGKVEGALQERYGTLTLVAVHKVRTQSCCSRYTSNACQEDTQIGVAVVVPIRRRSRLLFSFVFGFFSRDVVFIYTLACVSSVETLSAFAAQHACPHCFPVWKAVPRWSCRGQSGAQSSTHGFLRMHGDLAGEKRSIRRHTRSPSF